MTARRDRAKCGAGPVGIAGLSLVAALILGPLPTISAQSAPAEPRAPVGNTVSPSGTLLSRLNDSQPWTIATEVFSRDQLLALAGLKAVIEPRPDTVRLTLWGNLPAQSPFPILESSAVLHDSKAYDLDLTLLSGRAVLTSLKKTGPAKVWLRMPGEGWELTLDGAGTTVALELYGRWPHGVPFTRDPASPERPISVLSFQVLKGQADVGFNGRHQRLTAPPGPAFIHWDSFGGSDIGPQRREKGPAWANEATPDPVTVKALPEVVEKYLALLKTKNAVDSLLAMLQGADANKDSERAGLTREFAVLGLAATGALPLLADVLSTSKQEDVRETVVLALRHWIGSAPGRDLQLYLMLVAHANYPPRQAETVLQLLHSPFDPKDPVTYQTLIAYLQHERIAIRELARWHLHRLVPQGAKIAYDPYGTPEQRAKSAREWKELIPDGELPKKSRQEKPAPAAPK
jgi:hypothetical protein